MDLIIRREAEQDLAEASDWYKERGTVLRERFVARIESLLLRITRNPKQFPYAVGQIRRASVGGYPYSIYFRITATSIVVLAVLHHGRDLRLLDERLN